MNHIVDANKKVGPHHSPDAGNMVERMALALFRLANIGPIQPLPFIDQPPYVQSRYRKQAREIIAVMREPSRGMVTAAGEHVLNCGGIDPMHVDDRGAPFFLKGRETGAFEVWQVMIDEALASHPEQK